MRVNTNMNAMLATNNMAKNTALAGNAMEKLSSGLRINKAGDDAAGLAISEKMRSQIRGMEQANRNVQDGVSMVQTQEGALEEAGNIGQRMRELAVQAGNETLSVDDRTKISTELTALSAEMLNIADETKFNGTKILDGTVATTVIKAGADAETRTITNVNLTATHTTLDALVDVTDATTSQALVDGLDVALKDINTGRANMGAMQNRLESTASNLTSKTENLTAAESRIRDVDVAKEMVNLSKLNLITQAAQAMVGQAKQQPEGVLQLLR